MQTKRNPQVPRLARALLVGALVCFGLLIDPTPARSEDPRIHSAFHITQGYVKSRGFRFNLLGLDEEGTLRWTLYAMRLEGSPLEKVRVMTELAGERIGTPISGDREAGEAWLPHLAVAAGEYSVDRKLRFRIGLQRIPLGLFNEYRYVGLAYESTILPAMYLRDIGFISESFFGLSATGRWRLGDGSIQYILWGGEFSISQFFTSIYALPRDVTDALGGKIVFSDFGLEGLELGGSAYVGTDDNYKRLGSSDLQGDPRKQVDAWTVFLRYRSEWGAAVRAEYAESNATSSSYYATVSMEVTSWLRPFVMYDRFNVYRHHPERIFHDAWHFGVNVLPADSLAVKMEFQRITGNILDNNQPDPREPDQAIYASVTLSYF